MKQLSLRSPSRDAQPQSASAGLAPSARRNDSRFTTGKGREASRALSTRRSALRLQQRRHPFFLQ